MKEQVTYFLVKNKDSGEPMEFLRFHSDISKEELQEKFNEYGTYYDEHQNEFKRYTKLEFILMMMKINHSFVVSEWSNDDVVYY